MNPLNVSFLQEIMTSVAEQSRQLLPKSLFGTAQPDGLKGLVDALVLGQGEATGMAIAREIIVQYDRLNHEDQRDFFRLLARELQPTPDRIEAAARAYLTGHSDAQLARLQAAVESPRVEFFRRLNLAPGATAALVAMRHDLLRLQGDEVDLRGVDRDLRNLFSSWFNRGFLVLKRIDWQTPAAILEKLMQYEAVHEIRGWSDLRRRLAPADRRCFAFFHPSLVDEPLIFVQVALTQQKPTAIQPLLDDPVTREPAGQPTTAVFYSISNCQEGLRGISFGSFLIKQVVEELRRELPSLKSFVTLSPVPRFARWLDRVLADDRDAVLQAGEAVTLARLRDLDWANDQQSCEAARPILLALAAEYLSSSKGSDDKPVDPVAKFHLGNGARLEQINWLGDTSEKGLREAHGLMVNYQYDPKDIEANHENFANGGEVAMSRAVRQLIRTPGKPRQAGALAQIPLREDATETRR